MDATSKAREGKVKSRKWAWSCSNGHVIRSASEISRYHFRLTELHTLVTDSEYLIYIMSFCMFIHLDGLEFVYMYAPTS